MGNPSKIAYPKPFYVSLYKTCSQNRPPGLPIGWVNDLIVGTLSRSFSVCRDSVDSPESKK